MKRWFGSLAIARLTTTSYSTGTSGARSSTEGGGSLMCAHIVAAPVSRGYGTKPVSAS